MCLFADRVYQIPIKESYKHATNCASIINLFEKHDLMALLRGDPPIDRYVSDNQPALFREKS